MEPRPPRDWLEDSILEAWEEVLGTARIGIRTSFLALGGDGRLAGIMLHKVEETIGVHVPVDAFLQDPTIEGLAAAIEEARGLALPPSRIPFAPGRHDGAAGGSLFFVSDASSLRLARALGRTVPTYLLPYLAVDRPVLESIEATAERCLATVRQLQPRGPYRLGGYCLGGLVAFEVARRLEREGETVEPLILVAPRPWSNRWLTRRRFGRLARLLMWSAERELRVFARLTERVPDWEWRAREWLKRPRTEQIAVILRKLGRGLRSLGRRRGKALPPPRPEESLPRSVAARRKRCREDWAVYKRVNRAYVLGAYSGRVTIIWPERDMLDRPGYPDGLWQRVARSVDLHIVPGEHITCLTRYVEPLAAGVLTCLGLAQASAHRRASEQPSHLPATR